MQQQVATAARPERTAAIVEMVEHLERWQTLGTVTGCLLVLVVHTVRIEDGAEVIRIISARRAGRQEREREVST